jgi:acetyl esterase/lipase
MVICRDMADKNHRRWLAPVLLTMAALMVAREARSQPTKGVRAFENVPYAGGSAPEQRLDLYLPPAPSSTLVLFVHGGSLSGGDKSDQDYKGICAPLVSAGLECATVNYRLFPAVKWPAPARDVSQAVRWLKSNIGSRGGRIERLILFGHSSGCLLVSLLGTDPRFLQEAGLGLKDVSGVIAMGCRLNGAMELPSDVTPERLAEHFRRDPYDAGFGSVEALNDAVPTRHVRPGMPPFLILIAEEEQLQPPILADAQAFTRDAARVQGKATIVVLPGTRHMSALKNIAAGSPSDRGLQAVLKFARQPR